MARKFNHLKALAAGPTRKTCRPAVSNPGGLDGTLAWQAGEDLLARKFNHLKALAVGPTRKTCRPAVSMQAWQAGVGRGRLARKLKDLRAQLWALLED